LSYFAVKFVKKFRQILFCIPNNTNPNNFKLFVSQKNIGERVAPMQPLYVTALHLRDQCIKLLLQNKALEQEKYIVSIVIQFG